MTNARTLADYLDEIGEANGDHNDEQRRIIAELAEANGGEAWLGRINAHGERKSPILTRWDGGLVYNFGADFVVPRYDPELALLIGQRDAAPYTGVAADAVRVDAIMTRIGELGGRVLLWS